MRLIESYSSWTRSNLVNENIKAAKAWMIRNYADSRKIDNREISDEQRQRILEDPLFKKVIDITSHAPGYAYAFTRFAYEQRAPIPKLIELLDLIKAEKNSLSSLPMSVEDYANTPVVNGVPGYEALTDAFENIKRNRSAKWMIDSLTNKKGLRAKVQALPPNELDRFYKVGTLINQIDASAPAGADEKSVKQRLLAKSADFSDPIEYIEYAESYAEGYSKSDIRSNIEAIEALEPEAGVLFVNDRYIAISVRTESAQKQLCSVANWCINRGSFTDQRYGGGNIQLNIFDFGVPVTNSKHLTGTTITYAGKVTYSHDINDTSILKSSDPAEHLRLLGYPESLVTKVVGSLPTEAAIKKTVTSLNIDGATPINILIEIIKMSYHLEVESDSAALSAILKILDERIAPSVTEQQLIDLYMNYGVLSKFSASLFNRLLSNIGDTQRESIINKTSEIFSKLKTYANSTLSKSAAPDRLKGLHSVLAGEADVMDALRSNTITESSAQPVTAPPQTKPQTSPKPGPVPATRPSVNPQPKANQPTIAPPQTKPQTAPKPGPIPTTRPSVNPQPKATEEQVINRFMAELKAIGETPSSFLKK